MSEAPRDPLSFDFGLGFRSMADRVIGEEDERADYAMRALPYHHAFLDDYMRCIMPHDLILIGARTGVGKTELARSIAANNAASGKRVYYFALEAEPNEIERRTKFAVIGNLLARYGIRVPGGFNYPDWYCGRLEEYAARVNSEATKIVVDTYATMHTYYRGSKFGGEDIRRLLLAHQDQADLMVIDHLHYVDIEDENENRGFKATVKIIRDTALAIGRPIILVVHLRKDHPQIKTLTPEVDDVHGSSDTGKIATNVVMLAPAARAQLSACKYTAPKGFAATFVGIPKFRNGGKCQFTALCLFDWRRRKYADHYTLGYTSKNGSHFEPIGSDDVPGWAHHHQPLTIPFAGAEA